MPEPVNRTILLFDVEEFSRRDDVVQAVLRRSLNTVVDRTLVAAEVEAAHQYREDRGDGVIVLLGGDVAKTAVLRALLTVTPELLHEHNRLAADSAQMRLRMVMTGGEVAHDPQKGSVGGLVGHDLNQGFRLLDSDVLRDALSARTGEHCVLMVGPAVYDGVVRHGHRGVRPESFESVTFASKNGTLGGWLHRGRHSGGTGGSRPTPTEPVAGTERPTGAVFHFHGAPTVYGAMVGGDQHGVSGGQVDGDVVLGGLVRSRITTDADAERRGRSS
ncbi:hypothetical protein [Yinghuangia soli]|uniref:Uncharacterized protein n=1 Tax=Yinghuangia soli TaxID=2908204 RepID=A0AA41Q9F1_9ACTN|nr:hypothetical protein [Yinghuangia soli]MCF2532632.1 hypothetical protein [Yinghuangia soli]